MAAIYPVILSSSASLPRFSAHRRRARKVGQFTLIRPVGHLLPKEKAILLTFKIYSTNFNHSVSHVSDPGHLWYICATMKSSTNTFLEILFSEAKKALHNSYSPYSKFRVGASLRTDSDMIFTGANVENAAYGLTLCAEACAIAAMVNHGQQRIMEVVVIGESARVENILQLCSPCGSCRQRIREFSTPDTLIHLANADGIQETWTIAELLPYSFGPEYLQDK